MKFIDEAIIKVRAGDGGAGSASFRRVAFIPKGGPDGGDGGRGGDIIFTASRQLTTLEDISLRHEYRAANGSPGQGARKSGRSGQPLNLKIPVGVLIIDEDSGDLLADLTEDDQSLIAARGGRGGRGNVHFATSTNQTPRRADTGQLGEKRRLRLELKLLADVGLIGKPNAGKSTLLAALTKAHPSTGDYPFTTLSPALGVLFLKGYQRLVIADMPGIIEGAAEGRGLGYQFLRHIERTRALALLIESSETDFDAAFSELTTELTLYDPALLQLPLIKILSKSDLNVNTPPPRTFSFDLQVSSITGEGLDRLVELMTDKLAMTVREIPHED
ncbi:MAG: GTPase ObgE [Calditrichota bacterium]